MLLVLIVSNLWQLVRDYRRHVPGSRLRARMVSVLVMVAITPLVGVYIFSVEFINRGIDNWLNVDVEKGLGDALELGQTVLDIQTRGRVEEVNDFAQQLAGVTGDHLATKLNALRAGSDALEVIVYGQNRILGFTSLDLEPAATRYPTDEVLAAAAAARAVRQRRAATRRRLSDPGRSRFHVADCERCARLRAGQISAGATAEHAGERRARQLQPGEGAHVSAHGA